MPFWVSRISVPGRGKCPSLFSGRQARLLCARQARCVRAARRRFPCFLCRGLRRSISPAMCPSLRRSWRGSHPGGAAGGCLRGFSALAPIVPCRRSAAGRPSPAHPLCTPVRRCASRFPAGNAPLPLPYHRSIRSRNAVCTAPGSARLLPRPMRYRSPASRSPAVHA